MDSLGANCAEDINSTDCLLRTILLFLEDARRTDDAKYEWDPITFGFTVTIALIAAGFALITIVQAVLAAGPGRRKSNREAIGEWGKKTKWQWQWLDFGYLHIAQTPILTVKNVAKSLNKRSTNPKTHISSSTKTETENETVQHQRLSEGKGASWLNFLQKSGFVDLVLGDEAMRITVADYLPSDLVAVPTPVEVGLIFLLIALSRKPFRLLEPGSRYPCLTGPGFQFELRQHMNLGLIGAFSSNQPMSLDLGLISKKELELAARHAKGVLITQLFPSDPDSRTLFEALDCREEIDITAPSVISPWLAAHHFDSNCLLYDKRDFIVKKFPGNASILFGFLGASTPSRCPAAFPWSMLPVGEVFATLSISCNMTTEEKYEDARSHLIQIHVLELIFQSQDDRCLFNTPEQDLLGSRCRCQDILTACASLRLQFSEFISWLGSFPPEKLPQFRQDVLDLVLLIETWLRERRKPSDVICRSFHLLETTLQLQHMLEVITESTYDSRQTPLQLLTQFFREYSRDGPFSYKMLNVTPEEYEGDTRLKELTRRLAPRENFFDFKRFARPALITMESLVKICNTTANQPYIGYDGDVMIRETGIEIDLEGQEEIKNSEVIMGGWERNKAVRNDQPTGAFQPEQLFGAAQPEQSTGASQSEVPKPPDAKIVARGEPDDPLTHVLAWRTTLMAILFLTAMDTAPMLASGLWSQVIPMI